MWGYLKSFIFPTNEGTEGMTEVEEQEILDSLVDNTSTEEEDTELNKETKDGTITKIDGNLAIIDDIYFFNMLENETFTLNDRVNFTVFFNALKTIVKNVVKIDELVNKDMAVSNLSNTAKISGQIFNRDQRIFEVHVEGSGSRINFSLNNVKSDFVPYLGDYVDLEVVTCEGNAKNDKNVNVVSVRPKKTSHKLGVISSWDDKYGTISNFAIFTANVLEAGFSPGIGSKVCASLIRSDCINGYKWRAILVIPQNETHSTSSKDALKLQEESRNKRGIAISICPKFTVNLSEKLKFKIEVSNKSPSEKLMTLYPVSKSVHNQIELLEPTKSEISIKSGEVIDFHFQIHGKYIGKSNEDFIWDFKDFFIRRRFIFDIANDECVPEQQKNGSITFENYFNKKITAKQIYNKNDGDIMPGRRNRTSVFIPVKIGVFPLPKILLEKVLPENAVRFDDLRIEVEKIYPCLKAGLSPETYASYTHSLLYLEEIECLKAIARLDIDNASFRKYLDFLILEIPEHSFYTKLLLPGDYALVSLPWDSSKKMQGILYKITKSELWLMFSKTFHSEYKEGSCYFTSFVTSRSAIRRKHEAVDVAMKNLGVDWLFPRGVCPKPPQITFKSLEDGISVFGPEISLTDSSPTLPKDDLSQYMGRGRGKFLRGSRFNCSGAGYGRHTSTREYIPEMNSDTVTIDTISWFNPVLNTQQKEAVLRALAGIARPLPYVIFGPPGTGKTVTVVEAILQVHKLIPQSRILVATPTNSAADLIAQLLMEAGDLQEGDFLRLVGYNYAEQGRLISSLVPYSATPSFKTQNDTSDERPDIAAFTREQISTHRIIVSTVNTLGTLYVMGFPRGYFTHIFIDESGQADEPELMVAMSFLSAQSGQVILSGDPLQLGPVVRSQLAATYGLRDSFLVRLLSRFPYIRDPQAFASNRGYDPRLVTKLINNYRSLDGILQIFNTLFYEGDLVSNLSNENSEEAMLLRRLKSFNLTLPVIFHGLRGNCVQERDSKSFYNPQEVFQVFFYLSKLYSDGIPSDLIGIITPYQTQVKKIQEMLEAHGLEPPKIGSVEEFQGQERMVIIVSIVRSNEESRDTLHGDFVLDPRRVNVALSRARALLILIGDPHYLCADKNWLKIIRYCEKNGAYVGCQLPLKLKPQMPSEERKLKDSS